MKKAMRVDEGDSRREKHGKEEKDGKSSNPKDMGKKRKNGSSGPRWSCHELDFVLTTAKVVEIKLLKTKHGCIPEANFAYWLNKEKLAFTCSFNIAHDFHGTFDYKIQM